MKAVEQAKRVGGLAGGRLLAFFWITSVVAAAAQVPRLAIDGLPGGGVTRLTVTAPGAVGVNLQGSPDLLASSPPTLCFS